MTRFNVLSIAGIIMVATVGGWAASLLSDFSQTGKPVQPLFQGYFADNQVQGTLPTVAAMAPADRIAGNLIKINDNAGWCWFQDEKVICDPVSGIFVASTAANFRGSAGAARNADIDATTFNLSAGRRTCVTMTNLPFVSSGIRYGDDHNMGSLWIRPDGRYLHMCTGHNDASRRSYYRVSTRPHDGSAWGDQSSFNWHTIGNPDTGRGDNYTVTYNNLLYLSGEGVKGMGRLYDISRESQRSPNIAYSDDWGTNWIYGGKLSRTKTGSSYSNGYYKFCCNGVNRIDFIATEHHPMDYNTSIYHGYIQNGKSYNSFGVVVDTNIFDEIAPAPEDFTPVFLSSPEDGIKDANAYHRAWTVALERDSQDHLYALFTTRYGTNIADSLPGDADHRLFYARFDGKSWRTTELARMGSGLLTGQPDYTGLGAIDPDNPNLIYISTPFDPRDNKPLTKHEIFKGLTADAGATWHWTRITFSSNVDNLRPAIPKWDATHAAVFWLRGHYNSPIDFDQTLVALIDAPNESIGPARDTQILK